MCSCRSLLSSWPVCPCPGWEETWVWNPACHLGGVWRTWACRTRSLTEQSCWKWLDLMTWLPGESSSLGHGCSVSWRRWKSCDWHQCWIWLLETNLLLACEKRWNLNQGKSTGYRFHCILSVWSSGGLKTSQLDIKLFLCQLYHLPSISWLMACLLQ